MWVHSGVVVSRTQLITCRSDGKTDMSKPMLLKFRTAIDVNPRMRFLDCLPDAKPSLSARGQHPGSPAWSGRQRHQLQGVDFL